jgi:hypothetical protein
LRAAAASIIFWLGQIVRPEMINTLTHTMSKSEAAPAATVFPCPLTLVDGRRNGSSQALAARCAR